MLAPSPDSTLSAQLAKHLTDEQRQIVLEAPRGQRLKTLAPLLNASEAEALVALATFCGLDTASNLEADKPSLSLFPARLVHEQHAHAGHTGPRRRPCRSARRGLRHDRA